MRSTVDWPWPPQSLHWLVMMRPVPRQRPQVRATLKKPCWNVTWPRPAQAGSVPGCVPGALPLPPHVSHVSRARDLDVRLGPERGLLERQLEVVAQVGAAPRAAAAAAEDVAEAEEVAEDVAEVGEDRRVEAAGRRPGPAWP